MKKINFLFLCTLTAMPLMAQQESAALTAAQRRQALAIQVAEQSQQIPGGIYRGTVFGAEQKTYHSDTLGMRQPAQKKYVYDTSLMRAVKINDADRVRTLLYAHINADERNHDGMTPLTVAAENGNIEIIRLLIEEGKANVNLPSNYGVTPLIAATRAGKEDAAKYLIEKGAKTDVRDNTGKTPISYAAQLDNPGIIDVLSKNNPAGANLPDSTGMTPLLYASQKGYTSQARVLLNNGANPNYRHPSSGLSALAAASAEGNTDVMRVLLKDPSTKLDIPDISGRTPLMYAIEQEKGDSVRLLLKQNANVNAQDYNGMTPLMYAAAKGNEEILSQLLRQKNLQHNQKDAVGRTPLFYSVYAPSVESARTLLREGENLNQTDQYGNTPLLYAIKAKKDSIASFFIQQGASLTKADSQGATAFTLAPVYLPGSATAATLKAKQRSLQQDMLQEQASRLSNVRELEQKLRAEEAQVQQLRQQQAIPLQEQERIRNISKAQQVKAELQAQKLQQQQRQLLQQPAVVQNTLDNDPEIAALQRQLDEIKAKKAALYNTTTTVYQTTTTTYR